MKVLIVVEQFKEIDSIPYYYLVKTFQSAFKNDSNYELIVKYIAPNEIWTAQELSKALLETEFDIAVVSPLWHVHVELSVAKKLGKKLFICLWDSHAPVRTSNRHVNFRTFLKTKPECGHTFFHSCYEYSQYCNIIIEDYGDGEFLPNIYCLPATQDSSMLYPILENEKEHEFLFFGQMSTDERRFFIPAIKNSSLPFSVFGTESSPDWPEFAEINRKSKINLVLNEKPWGEAQKKGKIYEAAACENLAIVTHPEVYIDRGKKLFIENEHFVSINKDNYIDVIRHYIENPEERVKIAKQMYQHYMEFYSEKPYWYNIFKYSKDK